MEECQCSIFSRKKLTPWSGGKGNRSHHVKDPISNVYRINMSMMWLRLWGDDKNQIVGLGWSGMGGARTLKNEFDCVAATRRVKL